MTTILSAAASGMVAAQVMLDHMSNNVANFSTAGYKRERPMNEGVPDPFATPETGRLGVALTESDIIFAPGDPIVTGNELDFSLTDKSFVRVVTETGDPAVTRQGSLSIDAQGQVLLGGRRLDPPLNLPAGSTGAQVLIDGRIVASFGGETVTAGPMTLVRFANPAGLQNIGGALYIETANSGLTVEGVAGTDGFGPLQTGQLEGSNVSLADEMALMIVAQRSYSACAKTYSIGDEMLRIATNLTR